MRCGSLELIEIGTQDDFPKTVPSQARAQKLAAAKTASTARVPLHTHAGVSLGEANVCKKLDSEFHGRRVMDGSRLHQTTAWSRADACQHCNRRFEPHIHETIARGIVLVSHRLADRSFLSCSLMRRRLKCLV
jgi:hypothetical protein